MTQLHISSSPHIHGQKTTSRIMLDVIIALMPATIAGFIIFGLKALSVVMMCIAVCVISEIIFNKIVGKEDTTDDLSAVVTGLLLGLNLPADTPLWQAAGGSLFAIVLVTLLTPRLLREYLCLWPSVVLLNPVFLLTALQLLHLWLI